MLVLRRKELLMQLCQIIEKGHFGVLYHQPYNKYNNNVI